MKYSLNIWSKQHKNLMNHSESHMGKFRTEIIDHFPVCHITRVVSPYNDEIIVVFRLHLTPNRELFPIQLPSTNGIHKNIPYQRRYPHKVT